MPVAIVMHCKNTIPAVLHDVSDDQLLHRLQEFSDAPHDLVEETARLWLLSLPAPSGWFNSIADARSHIDAWLMQHKDG